MGAIVRALGWAGRFLLIFAALYLATSLYSFANLLMGGGFALGQPIFTLTAEELSVSIPFSLSNTGYYDVTDVNVTTVVWDQEGNLLSKAETLVAIVARGARVERAHNVSVGFMEVFSGNLTRMLLEDSEFKADTSIGFRYAQALGFRLGLSNTSLPWGAPLSNLSCRPGRLGFNGTHYILEAELSFENHSQFLTVSGRVRVEVYNERREQVGLGWVNVEAPTQSMFRRLLEVVIQEPSKLTGVGWVHLYAETPPLKFGPVVLAYG